MRHKKYAKATGLISWPTVNFEIVYFLNEETEGVLTDTLMNFHDWHPSWLSQLKSNVKGGQYL